MENNKPLSADVCTQTSNSSTTTAADASAASEDIAKRYLDFANKKLSDKDAEEWQKLMAKREEQDRDPEKLFTAARRSGITSAGASGRDMDRLERLIPTNEKDFDAFIIDILENNLTVAQASAKVKNLS